MSDKQEKFVCAQCGYMADGSFAGDICPQCGMTFMEFRNGGEISLNSFGVLLNNNWPSLTNLEYSMAL